MRVLVTGAGGFVGRWLAADLEAVGHEVHAWVGRPGRDGRRAALAAQPIDVTDRAAVKADIQRLRPDAIAHLAGVAFAPDAASDPGRALAVNVGGTLNVVAALGSLGGQRALLVAGSSDIYGPPTPDDLPLDETATIGPRGPYGMSKAAQEAMALHHGRTLGVRVVATRSFNHIGPGQRTEFAVPAFAARILAARAAREGTIKVGNIDVRRDFTDVRDVVRAYRLLLEAAGRADTPADGLTVNVASGTSVAIRDVIAALCALVGHDVEPVIDGALVRADDPPDITGNARRLRTLTGWRPEIPLHATLTDIVSDLMARP